MILTQSVKCPYCGQEQNHTIDLVAARDLHGVMVCDRLNPHHEGCGRYFHATWELNPTVNVFKIEGYQEATE